MPSSPKSSLVGIARLASESIPLGEKKQASYFEIESKSILNRNVVEVVLHATPMRRNDDLVMRSTAC